MTRRRTMPAPTPSRSRTAQETPEAKDSEATPGNEVKGVDAESVKGRDRRVTAGTSTTKDDDSTTKDGDLAASADAR
jgi:hypothetical protein